MDKASKVAKDTFKNPEKMGILKKKLSTKQTNNKQNLTEKREAGIKFFIVGLKLFLYQNKSFGLFLCSSLIFFLRSKSKQAKEEKYNKRFLLDYENEEFTVLRTALTSTLSSQFIDFIAASKSLVEKDILRKAIQNT